MGESQAAAREFARSEVAAQLRALGVREGGVLLVHTSFRAVRPVQGGPLGLIGALREALGPGGTLAELTAGVPYRLPKHCMVLRDGHPERDAPSATRRRRAQTREAGGAARTGEKPAREPGPGADHCTGSRWRRSLPPLSGSTLSAAA